MSYAIAPALQKAVFAALSGNAALASLIGAHIYDDLAPVEAGGAPDVYVTLGAESSRARGAVDAPGAVHEFAVEVVASGAGFKRPKDVAAAVCDALIDAPLALERGTLIYLSFLKARASVGRPPRKRIITLTFKAFVEDV